MPKKVLTGLDNLLADPKLLSRLGNRVAYLGHEASVTGSLYPGHLALNQCLGKRLDRLFGPQHGFATLDQDNMIETQHAIHPQLGIPIFSLYSETRQPTPEMLENLDTLIVDLQDVGTRVYTYIWTLYLLMKQARNSGLRILVLDRPNPVGGLRTEGNLPDPKWFSFVCMSRIPMRHSLTIGELALLFNQEMNQSVNLEIIPMKAWTRDMLWKDTGLAWVNPSPNLPTPEGTLVYPGSVLIEGTVLSEGRGTTRSLELIGHPRLDPYKFSPLLDKTFREAGLKAFVLRPSFFKPTFQKHSQEVCGGFQIHCTQAESFSAWRLVQLLLKVLYHQLDLDSFWNTQAYEYQMDELGIDYINGTPAIRGWIEDGGSPEELEHLENYGLESYQAKIKEIQIYT